MDKNSIRRSDHSLSHGEDDGGVLSYTPWYKHRYMMLARAIVGIALVATFIFWPRNEQQGFSAEEQARLDSAALHVALLPVEDCLPFYLAERTGIYKQLGLDVRIRTYQAQLDTDTALARGHAEVVYSDLARAIMLQQDSVELRAIATFEGQLQLITNRRGRVRKLSQLKEKMVAIARHSVTDYWSDRLTDTMGVARADIFRPQINNLRIRTDMICNGTMDAAFLPEPYASEAIVRGNVSNFSTWQMQPRLVALLASRAALKQPARRRQIQLLLQGYDRAVAMAGEMPAFSDTLAMLIRTLCLTPDSLADSIARRPLHLAPLSSPKTADVDAVIQWLSSREKIKKTYRPDSLITEKP
ncbi:MAG: ABC transporter substrate-binding protein [Bacteroidales bacterium]|nr:ABC transporter substrate-binding protein [Bacteroidales bacterium]